MTDPMKTASADAAATAAAFAARSNYAKGWEDAQRNGDLAHIRAEGAKALEEATAAIQEATAKIERLTAERDEAMTWGEAARKAETALEAAESRIAIETARGDRAEQMVCDLSGTLKDARDQLRDEVEQRHYAGDCVDGDGQECSSHKRINEADAALSLTEPVVGRWVSVDSFDAERDALIEHSNNMMEERDAAIARAEESNVDAMEKLDLAIAATKARDEVVVEAKQWRDALTEIIRAIDDEDGCMEINCEPLDPKETSSQQIITAVVRRVGDLQSWTRRYVMGEQMRGDATSEEEHARAQVRTLVIDRDDAIRSRDEVGIQLAAAQERLRLATACIEAADGLKKEVEDADIVDGASFVERAWRRYDKTRRALDTVPGDALAKVYTAPALFTNAPETVVVADALRSRVAQLEGLLGEAQQWVQGAMLRGLAVEALDVNRRIALALTPPSPAGTSAPASEAAPTGLRAVAVSHLEALGVDTDNVKGG